jgi:hypothetical protein
MNLIFFMNWLHVKMKQASCDGVVNHDCLITNVNILDVKTGENIKK